MMTTPTCAREDDVRQAAASGRWPAGLDAHADRCEVCHDVRLVAAALSVPSGQPPLDIEPRAIFGCARHVRRINVESRISFIVTATQAVVLVAIAVVLLSFVTWSDVVRAWSGPVDRGAWMYAVLGAGLVATLGLSRWLSQEH
jgi:hypothetical protein